MIFDKDQNVQVENNRYEKLIQQDVRVLKWTSEKDIKDMVLPSWSTQVIAPVDVKLEKIGKYGVEHGHFNDNKRFVLPSGTCLDISKKRKGFHSRTNQIN